MLVKAYDPASVEDRISALWEQSGAFKADATSTKEAFTISMPPPNATGQLHIGHAGRMSTEDILVRFARMRGMEALWIPGTDHAAIATENVVIKMLQEQGVADPRTALGREKLVTKIAEYVERSRETIRSQIRKMGSSCDWSRERYTLEPALNRCVNEVFTMMYRDGLIYRGHRIVNWDPRLQTTVSDDEVVWVEEEVPFYTFQYGPFQIGTVRPETKFGDKYVVMHPQDARYAQYQHGQTIELEWINGPIRATVIKDMAVDPAFGTGVMTITPWHTQIDFEIAERHGLEKEQIIDFEGKLLPIAGEFAGMEIAEARPKIVEKLKTKGLLVKVDPHYVHRKAVSQRGKGAIEPQVRLQWFIDVHKPAIPWKGSSMSLKEIMHEVVHHGDIAIIPERFGNEYFRWIDNLRDWCISRQIWWGHRVPVWYDSKGECHIPRWQRFLFVRHGESEQNVQNRISGRIDTPLTAHGRKQAEETAKQLKQQSRVARVIASPLQRARVTADAIASAYGIPVELWDDLQEVHYGEFEGKFSVQGKSALELAMTTETGEQLSELLARAHRVLRKLQSLDPADGDVVIVSHRTFLSVLFALIDRTEETQEAILAYRRSWSHENSAMKTLTLPLVQSEWKQDPDTLDTWFSSALWTWSTLIDPVLARDPAFSLPEMLRHSPDFKKFHPTSVLETAYDILFFWVARMVLMTTYVLSKLPEIPHEKKIPFKTVYLSGLVRTREGKKMSKSDPSTCIDPLEVIPKYGADALRLSMIVGQAPGTDMRLYEEKIAGYRNFVNKLWNAARFVLLQCEKAGVDPHAESEGKPVSLADRALLAELSLLVADVSSALERYRLSEAGDRLYTFTWDFFCDWYLELSKGSVNCGLLVQALRTILTLLHPYCPFVTEELWTAVKPASAGLLIRETWPQPLPRSPENAVARRELQVVIDAVTAIRKLRADHGIEAGTRVDATILTTKHTGLLTAQKEHIIRLARVGNLIISAPNDNSRHRESVTPRIVIAHLDDLDIHLLIGSAIDPAKEHRKIESELKQAMRYRDTLAARLNDEMFRKRAPEKVLRAETAKLATADAKIAALESRLRESAQSR